MADRSTGPVKPPVIDLTARNTNAKPEERPAAEPPPQAPPRRPAIELNFRDTNWPLMGGVALGGAVLGTVLTYLLANAVPLPARGPELPDLTPEVTAQGERLDALSAGLTSLQASTTRTQVSLDATIVQLDTGLTDANAAIAELASSVAALPPAPDLAPIETQLRTLKAQIDAIAAGASGADAGVIAASIASLETGITSLTARLDGVDSTVSALRIDIDSARQSLLDHIDATLPTEIGPALKLPLILSGLEGAFANGRPFETELDTLRTILPDLVVPATLSAAAVSGLVRPDTLFQRFQSVLPEILAARDTSGDDWAQSVVDWTKSMLALRPVEEIEGDAPEAVVSRLEGAMERRDYAAAMSLLDALPQAMRDKAALITGDLRAHAEAIQLVSDLRARALATTAASAAVSTP